MVCFSSPWPCILLSYLPILLPPLRPSAIVAAGGPDLRSWGILDSQLAGLAREPWCYADTANVQQLKTAFFKK
jgi:hypothetical protein